jgi:hypothetical protein
MPVVFNGRTAEQLYEMCSLVDAGGIKYKTMLSKIVSLTKENIKLENRIIELEIELDINKELEL